jgi:hypothetical protein
MHGSSLARLGLVVTVLGLSLSLSTNAQARPPRVGFVFPTYSVSHYAPDVPWSGPISTVATRQGDDSDIVVASDSLDGPGTIFSSRDAGRTWTQDDQFPADRVQSVTYDDDAGGWRCACIIATTAPDYRADGGGGLFETNSFFPPRTWHKIDGIFPSPGPTCPVRPAAHDIAISPDPPHKIYVGTDCGVAILTPNATSRPTVTTSLIAGASDQHVESLIVLSGGTVIVGGPSMGIWVSSDGGARWARSAGTADTVGWVHAFASDPRGDRAYVVANDSSGQLQLFETGPGSPGVQWTRVPINLTKTTSGCGGIPNVHVVEHSGTLNLYVGDRCDILHASTSLQQEPDSALSTGSWSPIPAPHADTRDLVFKSGTNTPYLETSDGGIARSDDGGNTFHMIGGPANGLNALQVDDVSGQLRPGQTDPDLYFATWHDDIWSMHGTTTRPASSICCEGFDIGMPRMPRSGDENRVSFADCDPCTNKIGGPYFAGLGAWNDAEQTSQHLPVSNPVFVSPGRYVQSTDFQYPDAIAGYVMTGDDGRHWHRIADFPGLATGFIRPAGPPNDPTLFFPYIVRTVNDLFTVGLGTVKHPDLTSGTTSSASCTGADHNCRTYQLMENFGSLGITPTNTAGFPVFAVDPSDPNRLIAPDTGNSDIRQSTNGGWSWRPISGLADQIDQHGAYEFSLPAWGELSPNASVISICPEDGQRVLIGTRQGGTYFSFDGGTTFSPVAGSGPIQFAVSVFWLPGCAAAYVGTWGRGIYRIDMSLHTAILHPPRQGQPQQPCAPVVCRLEHDLGKRIDQPHPLPSAAAGVLITNGAIIGIAHQGAEIVLDVTAGATATWVRRKPVGVVIRSVAWKSNGNRVVQAAFFLHGKVLAELRGPVLRLYPLKDTRPGKTERAAPAVQAAISFDGAETLYGNTFANLAPGAPFSLQVTFSQPVPETVVLEIDGRELAKYQPGAKVIRFKGDPALLPGEHEVRILEPAKQSLRTIAMSEFAVANGDDPNGDDK